MKKKMLSLATAVIMAVVSLTGCSNAFNTKTFTDAAEKYGMKKADSYSDYYNTLMNKDSDTNSVYYIMDSSQEADKWYRGQFTIASGPFPEIHVKECVLASEIINTEIDGLPSSGFTDIYMITAVDRQSAVDLYDAYAKYCQEDNAAQTDNCASGEKDGYSYSMRYMEGSERQRLYGVYLKGETVIYVDTTCEIKDNGGCAHFFCKKLGLISPLTLKK